MLFGEGGVVPRGRIRRTMPLAGFTARAAGGAMVAALREATGSKGALERFHAKNAERYFEVLGHSKGVLMKAGQMLSMIDTSFLGDDLSPYQEALARLQADAPPMDPEMAKRIFRDDLGQPVESVFAEFTDEPFAAASIGQVHRAVLHNGCPVAVKIQYPAVADAIRDDLANTELLATIVRLATSAAGMQPDFRKAAREITARISEEIDYHHEAANIGRFSELYRGHPFIRVPDIVAEACGDRVLTMTYVDGMNWAAAQQADQDLKNTWSEVIVRFVTGSFRHSNLFHADPHPGNYCFGEDGTVGFVDFGCVKSLPENQRFGFVAMTRAAVEGRAQDVRDLLVQLGFFPEYSTLTTAELYESFAQPLVEQLTAPQPVTLTPDAPQKTIRALADVRSSDSPVRRMTVPDDLIFLTRINLSMTAILGMLSATLDLRSILDEVDGVGGAATSLGEQHLAWVRDRRLPFGLDHRD